MTNARTFIVATMIALAGCQGSGTVSKLAKEHADLTAATSATAEASKAVGQAATDIGDANALIKAKAPETATETARIDDGVSRLKAVQTDLDATKATLTTEAGKAKKIEAALIASQDRVHELESKNSGLLNTLLTLGTVAGIGIAVLCLFWLRNGNGAIFGFGLFIACVAAQWIIAYKAIIGITALVAAGLYAAWTVYRQNHIGSELVSTVEKLKPVAGVSDALQTIEQSKATKWFVDVIQHLKGVQKSAATATVPPSSPIIPGPVQQG